MIFELMKLPSQEVYPGYTARFVHGENMTLAFFEIEPNRVLPPHSHHHEQIVQVIEGELDLTIDGVLTKLMPGMVAVIPPNASHAGVARVPTKTLDIFYPARDDFK